MFYGETAGFQLRQTIQCHRAARLGWKVPQPYPAFMPGELLKRGIRFCSHMGFLQKNLLFTSKRQREEDDKEMLRNDKMKLPKDSQCMGFF